MASDKDGQWGIECDCVQNKELGVACIRTISNGTTQAGFQCQNCGRFTVKSFKSFDRLPEKCWSQSIVDDFQKRQSEASERRTSRFNEERERKNQEWWDWYDSYLQSDDWKKKRIKALERDSFLCQDCLVNKAQEVHHLSYKNVGNEPLFELVSICSDCHKGIHNDKS